MIRISIICILWLAAALLPATAGAGEPPEIDSGELALLIHQQINRERQKQGLAAFDWDRQLAEIALNHSRDMASQGFFGHINSRGEDPSDRASRQGWSAQKPLGSNTWAVGVSENLYLNHLYNKTVTSTLNGVTVKQEHLWNSLEQIARSTVQGWMDSPPHRKNILSRQYDREGVGVAISGNDVYVTDDLF